MTDTKRSELFLETLLRQVVIEDFENTMASIPPQEELEKMHTFSARHEKQMARLFLRYKTKRTLRTFATYTKKVALYFLITGAIFFGLMMTNAEARAGVRRVVVRWFETFTAFTFGGDLVESDITFHFGFLPEGFVEREHRIVGHNTIIIFANEEGSEIAFHHLLAHEGVGIAVDNEYRRIEQLMFNNQEMFLMIALAEDTQNGVLWYKDDFTLVIWSHLDVMTLLDIALNTVMEG